MSILGYKEKKEMEHLRAHVNYLYQQLSPEQQKSLLLNSKLSALEKESRELSAAVASKAQELSLLYNAVEWRKKQIVQLDKDILLQECAIYISGYNLDNSAQYTERLEDVRRRQKEMVLGNTAVLSRGRTGLGSAQGKEMVDNYIRQILRTFNVECDNAIERATRENVAGMRSIIINSFETLNRFSVSARVAISPEYLNLRLEELGLAVECAVKRQEEEEENRQIQQTLKEQAAVRHELETIRKNLLKERQHHENSLKIIDLQLTSPVAGSQREALEKKKAFAESQLKKLEAAIGEVEYRSENQKSGYVYIISNIGAFGENVFMIGVTRRLDPAEYIAELGVDSVPFPFDIHAMIFSDDAPRLEAALHRAFEDKRLNTVNTRRGFFRVTLDEIKQLVKVHHGKAVKFTEFPSAEQFRRSQLGAAPRRSRKPAPIDLEPSQGQEKNVQIDNQLAIEDYAGMAANDNE